ncbi:hypothetical protein EV356DRAFT_500976 [Viridothelium virens]|uniref:Uncharacterized protein n=1 Tax=Viridothelium virens TaxID=1048519 RepID=A0A6A6HB19_VIRVR|nr:hypothetical protein EV356DRAFT_500976 [Viridothelium virens]
MCSGYAGTLPTLSGTALCAYTAITGTIPAPTGTITAPSEEHPFPFTSTLSNGAVIAYASSTNEGAGPLFIGSSSTVKAVVSTLSSGSTLAGHIVN